MIALHAGAGYHVDDVEKLCSEVIKQADFDIIRAVSILESDPRTNAGFGSNLNIEGFVECEAAYMSSLKLAFGGVACITNTYNPVLVAKKLADQQRQPLPSLVPPLILAGHGANKFAESIGLRICPNDSLVSELAKEDYEKALKNLHELEKTRLDTIGAVAIDTKERAESCVSSGGILLKRSGRVGHSVQFGAAIWAEQSESRSVAISVSGCGEALTRVNFARSLAEKILDWEDSHSMLVEVVRDFFKRSFLESRLLADFPSDRVLAGGIILVKSGPISELVVFHNTTHFAFAYSNGKNLRRMKSHLPDGNNFVCSSLPV